MRNNEKFQPSLFTGTVFRQAALLVCPLQKGPNTIVPTVCARSLSNKDIVTRVWEGKKFRASISNSPRRNVEIGISLFWICAFLKNARIYIFIIFTEGRSRVNLERAINVALFPRMIYRSGRTASFFRKKTGRKGEGIALSRYYDMD